MRQSLLVIALLVACSGGGSSTPTAKRPTFSPPGGTYTTEQSVTLASTTPGAVIRYTLDGTAPTATSTVYAEPIDVSTTTTIKAFALAADYRDSPVATATYTISGGGTGFAAVCADVMSRELTLLADCTNANPEFFGAANPFFQDACASVQAEITAGRVVYDSTGAAACRDALAALTCTALEGDTIPAACDGLLQGQVANAGACYDDVDCESGWCDTGLACPGVCTAFKQSGQDCTGSGSIVCAPGLACGGTPTETCQTPSTSVGASCPCGVGLWCDTSVAGGNTCKAKQTSGACDPSSDQCAVGYVCTGQTTTTCQPQVGLGGTCGTDPFLCGYGYACQDGSCVAGPKVGDACSMLGFCIGGYCDPMTQTCKAFKAEGAACTQFWECQSLDCSTGTCGAMFCAP